MSEDIKMGLGEKEMADVIGKVFGGAKKETTKTFVYKAKSDGVKELTKEIEDLVEVMSEAKNLNQSQRGVIKLFGGQEKIINNLKKNWNEYVTAVKNGSIDSDGNITITSSQNRKEYNKINRIRGDFLRSASVAKTVFGDDYLSKIVDGSGVDQSVIEEMKSTIQKLLSTESFKNFSQSPEKIAPVLEFLNKVEEKAKAAGMSLEQAFEFVNQNIDGFKDLNIDYKDVSQFELVSEVMRLVAQEAENAAKQQQNNASAEEEAAGQAEESARRTEEAVERETKAYENLEQIRNRAVKSKKEKHTFDDNDQFNQEMYWDKDTDHDVKIESDDIKSYQDALERLNALQQEALRSAQEYQNAYAKAYNSGDDLKANEHLQNMQRQIDYYNEYSDAIDYVQKQLTEATMNFKPGDSWGEDEIGVTIKLLQDLTEQINTIKESFSTIKSPEEFQVLITSIESVSEKLRELTSSFNTAFTSFDDNGEIISITNYFEKLISTIDELQKTMSQLDMNFSVKFGGNSNAKSPLEMADERRREQEAIYDQLLQERSEIEARIYGRYKSAQSPTQMIMSLFGNRKTPGLQNYTEWAAFAEEYSSQAIEAQFKKSMSGANSSLRRYIQKIVSGANLAGIDVSDIVSKYQPKDVDTGKAVSDVNELADAEDKAQKASEQMSDALSKLIKTTDLSPIIEQLETLVKQITQISESFAQLTESINNGLQISAKETAESLQGATVEIKAEGEAAAIATPLKEAMAEANKKLAESAENTSESTKTAADGIESEGDASKSGKTKKTKEAEYDDEKMKAKAKAIDDATAKMRNDFQSQGLVTSIQRMYDSHDNLVQAILTTKKQVEDEDGRLAEQVEHYNIHWNKKGDELYSSTMTRDDYEKYNQKVAEEIDKKREQAELRRVKEERKINEQQVRLMNKAQEDKWKESEKVRKKAEKEQAKKEEKQQLEQERLNSPEYRYNVAQDKIKALGEANTRVLDLKTKQLQGVDVTDQMADALDELTQKAKEAKDALDEIYKSKDIPIGKRDEINNLYNSDDIQIGDANSRDRYRQAQSKKSKKDLDQQNAQNFKKDIDIIDQYIQKQKELNDLRVQAIKTNLSSEQSDRKEALESETQAADLASEAYERLKAARDAGNMTESQLSRFKNVADAYNSINDGSSISTKVGQTRDALFTTIDKTLNKAYAAGDRENGGWRPEGWQNKISELQSRIRNLKDEAEDINILSPNAAKDFEELREKILQVQTDYTNLSKSDEWKPVDTTWEDSFTNKVAKWAEQNKIAAKEFREELEKIREDAKGIDNEFDASKLENRFSKLQTEAADRNLLGKSLGDRFKDQFKNTMTSLATYYLSFQDFIRYGREAIQVVTELDTAMMELKKVSNESAQSYSTFLKNSFDQADAVGGNAKQIIESAAAWKRLGKSFEESQEAAQASVKLLNVSEFENIDDATTSLVSMRQAFKDNTYDDFIDKLNGVGDSFSSSTDQIAYGMRNVSAVLKVAGNDIDQSIALLTAANDITQDMSKASMGVRTIALRISGTQEAKQELEDLGEDVSDFVVQTQSKVDAQVRKFTATAANPNGISVLDETGRLRNTYDILLDISKVYQDIVDKDNQMGTNTSNALLELLAGKTRSNILASILQNPTLLEQAYERSKNSQGVGQRELDIYLDSIEAKTAKLQNRLQELASTAIDSDFIKTVVEGLTKIVELGNKIVDTFGMLPTIIGSISSVLMQKNGMGLFSFDKKNGFNWDIKSFGKSVKDFFSSKEVSKEFSDAFSKMDKNLNFFDQVKDQTIGIDNTQIQEYADSLSDVQKQSMTAAQAMKHFETSTFSVGSVLKTVGSGIAAVASSMLTMIAVTVAIDLAFKGIQWVLDNTIFKVQNIIKAGEEATDKINDVVDSLNSKKDAIIQIGVEISPEGKDVNTIEESVDQIAKKYTELHNGVNELNNANEDLSTDKYQEYLDLCNQLAEQSPELVTGWDAQGNAILGLGNTAAEVEAALMRMYEAEKLAANVEIAQNIQDSYAGLKEQANVKETENINLDEEIGRLEDQLKESESQQSQIESTISEYNEVTTKAAQDRAEIQKQIDEKSKFVPQQGPYQPLSVKETMKRMEAIKNGSLTEAEAFPWLEEDTINNELADLNKQLNEYSEEMISGWATFNNDVITVPQYVEGLDQELNRIAKQYQKNGTSSFAQSLGENNIGEQAQFEISGLNELDIETKNAIQNQIANYVQSTINSQTETLKAQLNEKQSQKAANDLYIKDQSKSIQGIISNYLTTSDVFTGQSESIQNAILSNLDALDLSIIGEKYGGQIVPYIYNELIQPINELAPDAQQALAKIFEIKPDNKSANEYIQSLKNQIIQAAGDDKEAQQIWEGLLGVDKVQDEISSAQSIIRKEFMTTDAYGHVLENNMTDEQLEQLYGLSLDDLRIYADLVRDGVYETWEELQKAFEDAKNQKAPESTDTLSTLLNSEDYKSFAETASSNLSSLTGALETLRTEGSLTAEEMVNLQNSFPDLTEFTSEAIQTKAFEELDEWIGKIRESMKGMSEEGKEQARTMIQNMIDQYGDLGVSIGDIWDTYFDNLGVSNLPQEQAELVRSGFNEQVEELRSRLEAEGKELDMHVLYTIIASDQFSNDANELYNNYNNAELNWKITLDRQRLEEEIQRQQARVEKYTSSRELKEAKGETVTSEDYNQETLASDRIAKAQRQEADDAWDEYLKAQGTERAAKLEAYWKEASEADQAEADLIQKQKEQQEAGANEEIANLENSNDALADAQRKITKAEKNGGKASADLYESVASQYDDQAETNRKLGDIFQGLADNTTNQAWKTEWTNTANDYYDKALQSEADAKEQRLIPIQDEYNKLQNESTAIQHELTEAEQKYQKVSAKTYRDLISNGRKQINNLKQQQKGVEEFSDEWWSLQNSIDSMSDSMYDWSSTMDSLVYDQASQLASTIQTAISESASETGLTTETINALLTGFSDLTGKDLDVSEAFYNTADGVKVNTEALRELTQAEFDLMSTGITEEIQTLRDKMDGTTDQTVWNSYNDQLQQLMQTQAQYFAQYEEMQKALSYNNAIDIAESTENKGANYDSNYSRWKNYKEAYEKGEVGTDEFKAFTAYGDAFGRNTYEAFEGVMGKFERYFTEDATVGIENFLQDLKSKGLASYSEEEGWSTLFENEEDAARAMGMGPEFFNDMFGKIQDLGGYYSKVGSLTEYELNKQDLNSQLEDALGTYTRMYESGKATTKELEAQKQVIQDIRDQIGDNEVNKDNFVKDQEKKRVEDFTNLKDNLQMYQQLYDEATTDAEKETIRKMAQKEISKYGYDLKEGEIALSEKAQEDYESRIKAGSFEKPLSAETFGYTHNQENSADLYDNMVKTLTERKDEIAGITDELSKYSREELLAIGHSDGQWSAGEKELEQLCDTLGVSYENADLLVDALAGLGLIEFPGIADIPDALADGRTQVEEFLKTTVGKTFKDFNLDADVTQMSADDLNTLISRYESLRKSMGAEAGSDVDQFISSKIREAEVQLDIQTRIDGGSYRLEDLKQMTDEELASEFELDLNTDEGQAKLEELHNQLEGMEAGYDYTIHVDDTQFSQLMSAITGESYQAEVEIVGKDKVTSVANKIKQKLQSNPITQPIVQKVQQFGEKIKQKMTATVQTDTGSSNKDVNEVENNVEDLNKTTGTAKVNVDTKGALSRIQNVKNQLSSLNSVTANPRISIDTSNAYTPIFAVKGMLDQLKDKTVKLITKKVTVGDGDALGTAHASGTTSLSRAYAGGSQDWTVGRDESALVNEIGQESRVRDGVWELIPGGPHVEDLKKDDIIFNAEQTADLIRTGKTARRGQLVAHVRGTADGMPAFKASTMNYKSKKKKSSSKGNSGGNGNGGKGNKGSKNSKTNKTDKKLDAFNKWIEKLFDWIEVRLDRIQWKIDVATKKAENAIGYMQKNLNINQAMRNISSVNGNEKYSLKTVKDSDGVERVTGISYSNIGANNSLINNNLRGADRYLKEANAVRSKATSGKTKILNAKDADAIIAKIQSGQININEYNEKTRKFIDSYKQWYDKAMDCVSAVEELKGQLKDLEQQKLDNIVDQFDTITGYAEAVKASSEATIDYYNAAGYSKDSETYTKEFSKQQQRQSEVTKALVDEIAAYKGELANAKNIYGENSNQYREALTKLEEVNKTLIESQKTERELAHALYDTNKTVRGYFIDRVKALVDKFSSIASLSEKRGTTQRYGINIAQSEDPYFEQTRYNNELILKYYEDIKEAQREIAIEGAQINSERYEELYKTITDGESAITSLLSTNEDLKESIRTLRWKGYNEFQEQLNTINSDLEHIQGFIRDGDIMDNDAQFTDLGFAQIALIGEQMDTAEKKIRNAQGAIAKLDDEYQKHTISLEKYNEELDAQIDIIQDASGAMFDYQQKLADMYIDQITAENDALQDLIQARKEALSAKKEYYDYDKTLKSKNKDIAQLQAQINALNGVTNDAAKAKRAQLQAQLAEKQEDLDDTLYQHSIDLQQEGYDKLSEDMQKALDNAVKLINGDQKVLQDTANHMLDQLKASGIEQKDIVSKIISDNGTKVHNATKSIIDELEGEGGVTSLLRSIGTSVGTIGDAIKKQALSPKVTNIDTNIPITENSKNENISGKLEEIEKAIGTLTQSEEQKKQEETIREEKKADVQNRLTNLNEQKLNNQASIDNTNSQISSINQQINNKNAQINALKKANDAINKNISNLYNNADSSFQQANKLEQQADALLKKADKAKKKKDKKKYKQQAQALLNQAAAKKVQGNNYIKQYEKAVAAKPGQIKANDNSIAVLTSEISILTDSLKPLQEELKTLQEESSSIQTEIEAVEKEGLELELKGSLTDGDTAKGESNIAGEVKSPTSLITEKDIEASAAASTPTILTPGGTTSGSSSKSTSSTSKTAAKTPSKKDQFLAAINSGKSHAKKLSSKEKKEHHALWEYLVKQFGRTGTNTVYTKLASLLSVKLKNTKKITNAEKDKILSKLKSARKTYKFAKGTKNLPEDLLAWTNENWDKIGPEIIVRPQDNAILTPMKANDSVIPANLADNLFKWGAISPDKFITNPFVGKWDATGSGSSSITNDDSYLGGQTVEMHFDSLFHIEGNVDESVMPRLENLGKSLVNDRDFQKNVIKFVTKDFVRESKKQGIR